MKVSIVTVSFNAVRTIDETLRSVLTQEGVDLEYIVVDGGSDDGTVEVIRKYQDRLSWWVTEPDRGQVDALNKGFARATGDILGFLNADDVLSPGSLKVVCDRFAGDPTLDLVYGGVEWIDIEGRQLGTHRGQIASLEEILDIYDVWWKERQWVQPEVFLRKTLKDRVGCFDESYRLAFDYDFWVRCFLAGAHVAHVSAPVVQFRRHAAQKSADYEGAVQEIRAILGKHLKAHPPIPRWKRWALEAHLSYDLYQSSPPQSRLSFGSALCRHPAWLLSPAVRARIAGSVFQGRATTESRP